MFTWVKSFPKHWFNHTLQHSMHTIPKPKDLPKNLNVAKLIGVVSTEVFSSTDNKSRVFNLKTFYQDKFYDNHKIIVSPYALESLPGLPETGQKILVSGKLRTQNFTQQNGKKGTSISIMAKQIYLCQNDHTGETQFQEEGQNRVDLLAPICFEILNQDKFSVFSLALNYLAKNSDGLIREQTDFVNIFVYDETLRNIVRNQLNKSDRVRVEGQLKQKVCVDDKGNKRYMGYIEATKIAKLVSFRRAMETRDQVKTLEKQAIK